ncbi:MAG: hypothetical protein VX114_00470 [Chloroflexota bacterium]|nr:hypothetical protein [Chloroflexota bacterium]|tara:strand:- start:114 stop:416 length:303 start_codon:yes stop_codon:yes gene_type:complete
MKKLIFIVALLIISCSNQESFEFAEGKILNIEKGAKTGSFEFIDVNVKNKEVRFYSNNKNYGHYTYDHLISHQISGDFIEINYKNESGKNLIISFQNHDH